MRSETYYSKVPLYLWRMSARLVEALVAALEGGARAHEEIFVPTACQVLLNASARGPCKWAAVMDADLGIPCGSNENDAWNEVARNADAQARLTLDRAAFREFFAQLQLPGQAAPLLPMEPQRVYHPVKGQLVRINTSHAFSSTGKHAHGHLRNHTHTQAYLLAHARNHTRHTWLPNAPEMHP